MVNSFKFDKLLFLMISSFNLSLFMTILHFGSVFKNKASGLSFSIPNLIKGQSKQMIFPQVTLL